MNILLITSDPNVLNFIKSFSYDQRYNLNTITSEEELNQIIQRSYANMKYPVLFSPEFDIIILDVEFLQIVHTINLNYSKDDISNYPILLLISDYKKTNIQTVLSTNITTTISYPLDADKLSFSIILAINNFIILKEFKERAFKDPLTNLLNRRSLMEYLDYYFEIYRKTKLPFCFGIIDLDHFKFINDTFGHLKGDEVLGLLADIMKKNARKTDILARMGGEEFAIIFPDTNLEASYTVLERIRQGVNNSTDIDEMLKVTLSAGLTKVNSLHKNYDDIIKDADLLLYQAKDTGRNKICK